MLNASADDVPDTPLRRVGQRLRSSAWTLPLAALAALVLLFINEAGWERSTSALTQLGERAQARAAIQRVWRGLIDAETGQRGYLLTGRPEYLAPYRSAGAEVDDALRWLQAYYRGDAVAGPLLAQLRTQSAAKLSELATTLDLHDRGRTDTWRELLLTDIGREKMDAVRVASQQLLALEGERVRAEREDVVATLRLSRLGINAMTLAGLLALFVFLRQTLAVDRVHDEHARALRLERDRLEAEVERRTADLTELARHLQSAREDERSRLARELHDELGALLTAAKLDAARLKRLVAPPTPDVEARLQHLNESINRGIELKRRIIEDLRPSSLSNLGLVAALEILTREHAARSGIAVDCRAEPLVLTDSAQITAFRLVQEALTNIAKHAGARRVQVRLAQEARQGRPGAVLEVQDDGTGFDPEQGVKRGGSHGLMGMRYRVEAEGGQMTLQSAPGQGTRLAAWLPLKPADDAAAAAAADEGAGAVASDHGRAGTPPGLPSGAGVPDFPQTPEPAPAGATLPAGARG